MAMTPRLSRRQQAVLELYSQGYTNVEIADMLGISTKTVESHKDYAKNKMRLGHTHGSEFRRAAIERYVQSRLAAGE